MPKNSDFNLVFRDRTDAAEQLISDIPMEGFKGRDIVVIAVSDGGIEIADIVASRLGAKMDILLSEPIPAPHNHELPIAIVSETKEIVINHPLVDAFDIDHDYIYADATRRYDEHIISHIYKYRHGESISSVTNKTVLLIDECIETGITIMVAIKSMISQGATNIYVAVPLLDEIVYDNLLSVSDGVFAPHKIRNYISIEYYYGNLEKPTPETIERILDKYE